MDRLPVPRNPINHDSWLMDRLSTSINHPLFLSLQYRMDGQFQSEEDLQDLNVSGSMWARIMMVDQMQT